MITVAQTINGMEDISITEAEELIGIKAEKLAGGRIKFETTPEKAKELAEKARSLLKVYELKQDIEFSTLENLSKKVELFGFEDPFVVRCRREGEHGFHSIDAEKEIGEVFYNSGHKVDLHKPKTTIMADITGNKCYLGIDLAQKDLDKREYIIRAHPRSINACLAYCLLRLAGWTGEETLLDPFCKDGKIVIEAALWAEKPKKIVAMDAQFVNINSSQINSKVAGVHDKITFLQPKEQIPRADIIVTNISKNENPFHLAGEALPDGGTITIATQTEQQEPQDFKLINKREAKVNEAHYTILTYKKTA